MTLDFRATAAQNGGLPPPEQVGPQKPVAAGHHFGFRDLLADLNPLQYMPVIGTLFRFITGNVVPEPVRDAGSLVFSTVIGGPIGAAIDLAALTAEKVTGIDPEKIGDRLLADVGIGGKKAATVAAAGKRVEDAHSATMEVAPASWSRAQLTAYGVTTSASGELAQGNMRGSDVLNNLELDKIHARLAIAQYSAPKSARET